MVKKKRNTQPLPELHILDTPKPALKVRAAQMPDRWEQMRSQLSEQERRELEALEQQWGWDKPKVTGGAAGRKARPDGYMEALEAFLTRWHIAPRCFDRNDIATWRKKGLL